MTEIADPGNFFNVSNYAALDDILSSLEQSLIGVEGKKVSSDIAIYKTKQALLFSVIYWRGPILKSNQKTSNTTSIL